jgi:diguanylate cyclase (GGDEF)-like protein
MNPKWRIILVTGLILGIGLTHYSCQLYWVQYSQIHNVILKFFFVPIILSAFWWGVRGGAIVGLISAAIYSVDIFRWREIHDPLLYHDLVEVLLFIGLGILLGWMVNTDRRCRLARVRAEARAEEEFHRSIIDSLTQAYNRRYMDVVLEETWNLTRKGEGSFSLLMVDLDNFKSINDRYGHPVGDRVLQATAQTIFKQIRQTDLLFRYGGDEFLILLPQTRRDRAFCLAQRLRDEMAKLIFQEPTVFKVDFSVGVVEYQSSFKSIQELLSKLDESLYLAKKKSSHVALVS